MRLCALATRYVHNSSSLVQPHIHHLISTARWSTHVNKAQKLNSTLIRLPQLTGAFLNLNSAIDNALRAYVDHTRVVLNGDATLDVSFLAQPIGLMQPAQQMMAQMALQQNGGGPVAAIAPMLQNGPLDLPKPEDEGDGKKKRKKRAYKPRDPNAPKRPLTAYFRYLGEMRPLIQQEMTAHPDRFETSGKPGDISRIATDRWNLLKPEEQQPYKAAYQAELKDYEIAIATYKAAGGMVDDTAVDLSAAPVVAGADEPVVATAAASAAPVKDDDSSDDDSSSDEEEESPVKAPPPPVATSKKAAAKKGRQGAAAVPNPVFNTVNDDAAAEQLQAESAKSTSPSKKRKSAETTEAEGSKKKRGRKTKDEPATSEPPPASSPPVESSGKKKKDKKKKKAGD